MPKYQQWLPLKAWVMVDCHCLNTILHFPNCLQEAWSASIIRKYIQLIIITITIIIQTALTCLMETRSRRARKGLAGVQRAGSRGEERGPAPWAAGVPMSSTWAPGRGLTALLRAPAQLGPGLIFLAVGHKFQHILRTVQDVPQAAASCIPLPSARCLHKPSARRPWERLAQSRAIYRISRVSHPPSRLPLKRQGDFSQTSPKCWDFLGRGRPGEEARQPVGSTPEAPPAAKDQDGTDLDSRPWGPVVGGWASRSEVGIFIMGDTCYWGFKFVQDGLSPATKAGSPLGPVYAKTSRKTAFLPRRHQLLPQGLKQNPHQWASLGVQWLGIHLARQGTGVQSLAGENRIPHVVEQLSPCATTIEAWVC